MNTNFLLFFSAAFFEIFGCFTFWLYFRLEKTPIWLGIGLISLFLFAYILTKIDVEYAGRIYAVYGGIYIIMSLLWMVFIEKESINKWDTIGSSLAFLGAFIIYFGNKNI